MASNRLLTCKFCKKFEGAWGQTASKHWKLFPIQKNSDGTPVLTNRGHVMADTSQNPHECFGHAPIPQGEEPGGQDDTHKQQPEQGESGEGEGQQSQGEGQGEGDGEGQGDEKEPWKSMAKNLEPYIKSGTDENKVREIAKDEAKKATDPLVNMMSDLERKIQPGEKELVIKLEDAQGEQIKIEGQFHEMFPKLVACAKMRIPVLLIGPPGGGKSEANIALAKLLNIPYYELVLGPTDTSSKAVGFFDAQGRVVATEYRKAWTEGGVLHVEEIDNASAAILTTLNSMWANGIATFPDGRKGNNVRDVGHAEHSCEQAVKLDLGLPEVHAALGMLYVATGQNDFAEREFRRAVELDASSVDAQLGLGRVLTAKGDVEAAERAYQEAIRLRSRYWRVCDAYGGFLYGLGRWPEAIAQYWSGIELAPRNTSQLNNLGGVLFMSGDFAAAADAFRRSVDIAPTSTGYTNTGTNYYYAGRYGDAVAMFEQATRLAPEDPVVWGNLGDGYRRTPGQEDLARAAYANAAELARGALRVNPDAAATRMTLAYYLVRQGQSTEAATELATAGAAPEGDLYSHSAEVSVADPQAAGQAVARGASHPAASCRLGLDPERSGEAQERHRSRREAPARIAEPGRGIA